jgi:Family of unknown function (DUF6171)
MNNPMIDQLFRWLDSDNPTEKAHAERRLKELELDRASKLPAKTHLQYPSLAQQAKNAAVAAGSVIASIVRREPVAVSQEEQDRRLAICHACEFWDAAQGRCSKCGCFGAWKTWLASQRCPIEKW